MNSVVESVELDENKSDDKREIEDEEREKMLNEENKTREPIEEKIVKEETIVEEKKQEGEVEKMKKVLEETEKEGLRKKIPIGGIKMPGFLRSRSKEKANKDVEAGDVEEGTDLLEPPCVAENTGTGAPTPTEEEKKSSGRRLPSLPSLPSIKISNPFAKKTKEPSVDQAENGAGGSEDGDKEKEAEKEKPKESKGSGGKRILDAIRLPLVSVFPRKLKSKDKLASEPGAAGLASMETLDDSIGVTEKTSNGDTADDGMESVKLDVDTEKADLEKDKGDDTDGKGAWRERLQALEKWKLIVAGVVIFLILLLLIILLAALGPRRDLQSAPLVDGRYVNAVTSCGHVQGVLEDGAFAFRGIPYARPPVEDRRWQPAEPLNNLSTCWNDTLMAHNATPSCWQLYHNGSMDGVEDCLTLEIFTPYVRYYNPLPVVVLVGAESFVGDSPGILRASAKLSRSKEVVFVRPNFRMGVLGFLTAESLTKSVHPPTSGNYALSDIVTALQWIHYNIEHFGGDKKQVTILGHRAGGTMVTVLTSSKSAKGLFARAWVSSGSAILPGKPLSESEAANAAFVASLGCDKYNEANCLRRLDVEEILDKVPNSWRWQTEDLPDVSELPQERREWLVKDGVIVREHPKGAWENDGLQGKLVMGTTAHVDASPELRSKYPDEETIGKHVRGSQLEQLGLAEEAIRRYGPSWAGLVKMVSDIRTVCPLLTIATGQSSVPFYVVSHPRDVGMGELADVGADVAAILGVYQPRNVEQRRYISAMQDLFYRYVQQGELKSEEADKKNNNNRILVVGQDTIPNDSYSNCDFWINKDVVPRYGKIH